MTSSILQTYREKADFFDQQVNAPWAVKNYTNDELVKLEKIREELGDTRGKKILEPGCGTGRLTKILSDWVGENGSITALDVSSKMIDQARENLAGRKNVMLQKKALEELPLQNFGYDVVFHHQVFPHYNNKLKALNITAHLLKPDGKVIIHHFINIEQINDTHRKAGTAVEADIMPEDMEMYHLFNKAGLSVKYIVNSENGYLLSGKRNREKALCK